MRAPNSGRRRKTGSHCRSCQQLRFEKSLLPQRQPHPVRTADNQSGGRAKEEVKCQPPGRFVRTCSPAPPPALRPRPPSASAQEPCRTAGSQARMETAHTGCFKGNRLKASAVQPDGAEQMSANRRGNGSATPPEKARARAPPERSGRRAAGRGRTRGRSARDRSPRAGASRRGRRGPRGWAPGAARSWPASCLQRAPGGASAEPRGREGSSSGRHVPRRTAACRVLQHSDCRSRGFQVFTE